MLNTPNPWHALPVAAPFILPCDAELVKAHQAKYQGTEFEIQSQLLPYPFCGDPNASVYVLTLNPGYASGGDERMHAEENYSSALRANLVHNNQEYPIVDFDPRFADTPGSQYFLGKFREFIEVLGPKECSNSFFLAELFPYHSSEFKALSTRNLPPGTNSCWPSSSSYTFALVRKAIEEKKHIVVMRSYTLWRSVVPELASATNVYQLHNVRNPTLSRGNFDEFEKLSSFLIENEPALPKPCSANEIQPTSQNSKPIPKPLQSKEPETVLAKTFEKIEKEIPGVRVQHYETPRGKIGLRYGSNRVILTYNSHMRGYLDCAASFGPKLNELGFDFEPTHDKPDQYWAVKISEFEAANKINNNFDGLVGAIKEFSGP